VLKVTHLYYFTYLLHGAESFLRSKSVLSWSRNSLHFMEPRRFITAFTSVPILSHIDAVHALTSHFLKIHLSIILPTTPGSPKLSHSLRFPHQSRVYTSAVLRTHLYGLLNILMQVLLHIFIDFELKRHILATRVLFLTTQSSYQIKKLS